MQIFLTPDYNKRYLYGNLYKQKSSVKKFCKTEKKRNNHMKALENYEKMLFNMAKKLVPIRIHARSRRSNLATINPSVIELHLENMSWTPLYFPLVTDTLISS